VPKEAPINPVILRWILRMREGAYEVSSGEPSGKLAGQGRMAKFNSTRRGFNRCLPKDSREFWSRYAMLYDFGQSGTVLYVTTINDFLQRSL
jgi:hypothetical protein